MNLNPAKPKPEREHSERQDWAIVLLILLIGLCGVMGAGQWALRFVPNWQLDADMGSNLDLNSEFLTSKPIAYFEPVDPAILTQPAWVNGNVFLTPGAGNSLVNNTTPLPTLNPSTGVPTVIGTTAVPTNPGVVTNTVVPTNTLVWIPIPATKTPKPGGGGSAPTNTSPAPLPNANLGITQSDGTTSYVPGGILTYTVTVTNSGPSGVNGATITNAFTSQVTGASWSCAAAGTVCGAGGPGTINDVVNLPVGSSITYTVNVNINAGASDYLVHTASVSLPAGYTGPSPISATDTNTASATVNLWITKTDNATHYVAGGSTTYTVTVGNNGPSNVIGATVADTFAQISNATWTCGSTTGGSCTPSGSDDINDTAVNLPAGSSVTYTINATIDAGASGVLSNTATVSLPVGYTGPSPVSATDTDTQIIAGPPPAGMATYNDSNYQTLDASSGDVTLAFSINAAIDDDADPDIILYEEPNGGGIRMDWMIVEISDGHNWSTLLNWGDNAQNNNTTNLLLPIGSCGSTEVDNCDIGPGVLYNNTGILLNIPASLQDGPTSYLRITVLYEPPPDDGNVFIDAVIPY